MTNRKGFALIAALWLLVALSGLGLEFARQSRAHRLSAANVLEGARAEAAAHAGIEHARAILAARLVDAQRVSSRADPARAMDPWGAPEHLFVEAIELGPDAEQVEYAVTLRDAGAALNLNRASEEELRRLFGALRVDAGLADRLAQTIADWRDADDLHRARGAERDQYLRDRAAVLPPNRPFQRVAELQDVRGMTPEVFARVRPHLTVLGSGQVNLNSAGREVLLAVPGMNEEAVAVVLRIRRQGRRLASLQELTLELSAGPRQALVDATPVLLTRTTLDTREVEVVSEGRVEGSPVRVHVEGLLVRGGDHAFLVWRSVL
jgi:general secretion pathway protein K